MQLSDINQQSLNTLDRKMAVRNQMILTVMKIRHYAKAEKGSYCPGFYYFNYFFRFSVFKKFTGSPYIRTNLGIGQVLRMQWAMTGQKQPQWGLIILTATV